MNLTSPADIKELMKRYDLHFTKRFGQNFLIDSNVVQKIADAAQIGDEDLVVEIGPGIGTLTNELAKQAKDLLVIEIDKKLIPVLDETLADYDNIQIINDDILKVNLEEVLKEPIENGQTIRVAANLPYYITTPIIMGLLESDLPIKSMSFLVQKEVADRMAAEPGSKTYGSLSVVSQYYADVKKAFDVPASVFMPKPNVDSALVTLTKRDEPPVAVNKDDYFRVVKAAFANRRKTLLNTLSSNLGLSKETVEEGLNSIGIDPKIRAEKLDGKDFEEITKVFFEKE